MQTALFTFSGTGNTALAASMLRDAFLCLGSQAETYNIEKLMKEGNLPGLSGVDAIGIGYPVYAFNSPKIVLDFVKLLPEGEGRIAYIYKTAGEPFYWNDSSSILIIKHLKRKGYNVVFERHLLMPYNILKRYPDALVKQMYLTTNKLCCDMAKRIISGESSLLKFKIKSRLATFIFRIQWPGAALNGRLYGVRKSCNQCMKCANNCPTGNIVCKKGRMRFGWKCIMCMRCVMYCPKNAIKFGLLPFWAINGAYDFKKIMNNADIPDTYVNENTKGFFRLFKKYYRWADAVIKEKDEV